jgi:hypothetical protein
MSGILQTLFLGAAAAVKDAYFNLVTLLLNTTATNGAQNNTFLDSSTNNFSITRNGNTTQGTFTPFSQTGWSNYFGGSDYLTAPSGAAVSGNSAFTVEFWIFMPVTNSGTRVISGAANQFVVVVNSDGSINYGKNGVIDVITVGAGTSMIGQWNHIVIGKGGASGTARIWRNGTSVGTATDAQTYTAGTVYIGSTAVPGNYLTGYISNLRITNTDVYGTSNTTITVPILPLTAVTGTSLLTSQDNRFKDNSTNAFAITTSGTPSVQAFSPFAPTAAYDTAVVGGSGYFDGSGDYLSIPDNTAFNLSTGSWTIEAYVYPSTVATRQVIIGKRGASNPFTISWYLEITATGALQFTNNSGASTSSSSVVKANAWGHCAASYDGTNLSMYYNGTRVYGPTAVTCNDSAASIYIGGSTIDNFYLNGYANSVRVVKGTAVYSGATIAVPTAPLTAISGTSLLTNYTNAGIFDSTAKNVLETVGNAQVSTTQAKWGTTSMAFDGTGDYLFSNPATTDLYAFGSGDWTIEFWAYLNSVTGTQTFYDGRPASVTTTQPTIYMASAVVTYYTGGSDRITGSTLSTGQWYHIAVSRSGTSTKMFVNGTQAGSTYTDSTVYTNTAGRPVIAASGSSFGNFPLNGYLDDFRITKGYARYTANFTAPTAAFPLQ